MKLQLFAEGGDGELIDTQQDVNTRKFYGMDMQERGLIDTQWDVNNGGSRNKQEAVKELIDTQWDVN